MRGKLSVVVVAHELTAAHRAATDRCVEAIRAFTDVCYEAMVVDNGSPDAEALPRRMSGIRHLRLSRSVALPEAWNLGAQVSGGDILVFLHNDQYVRPGWAGCLARELVDDVAIAGTEPWQLTDGGELVRGSAEGPFDFVRAGGMAVRRAVFRELGGFDPTLGPNFPEAIDLCLRARERGYDVSAVDGTLIEHLGSLTLSRADRQLTEGLQRLARKRANSTGARAASALLDPPVIVVVSLGHWGMTGGGQRPQKLAEAWLRRGASVVHAQHEGGIVGPPPGQVRILDASAILPGGLLGRPGARDVARFWERVCALCTADPSLAFLAACTPAMVSLAGEFQRRGATVIYDVLDDWEEFARLSGPKWYRRDAEERLVRLADRVTAVSPALVRKLGPEKVTLSPNAADWNMVVSPRVSGRPADLPADRGVTIGYVGTLGGQWHDWAAVAGVAQARPGWRVVLIGPGGEHLPPTLSQLPNVCVLAAKPHDQIAAYLDSFDVAIIPFQQNALCDAVSPIKAYDYLARGCPVVSSPMSGVAGLPGVAVAGRPEDWVRLIAAAAKRPRDRPIRWLWENTWDARVGHLGFGRSVDPQSPVLASMHDRFRSVLVRPEQTTMRVHWQMAASCNYRCPYCIADWEFQRQGARWTLDEMRTAWERFNEDHGACQISVSGLEPMHGRKNLRIFSWLSEGNVLDFDTNFSFPLSALKQFPYPDRVVFSTSFHPSSGISAEEFIAKVRAVRAEGFTVHCASLVCYPPYLEHLARWREQFAEGGIAFVPRPFVGTYEGRRFPEEYNAAERALLGEHLSPASQTFQLGLRNTHGTLCAAGWLYLLIQADGMVLRCNDGAGDVGGLNFYHDHIPRRDYPTLCAFDRCWCEDYWAYHLSDNERRALLGG